MTCLFSHVPSDSQMFTKGSKILKTFLTYKKGTIILTSYSLKSCSCQPGDNNLKTGVRRTRGKCEVKWFFPMGLWKCISVYQLPH